MGLTVTLKQWRDGRWYYNRPTGTASPLYKVKENAIRSAEAAGYSVVVSA